MTNEREFIIFNITERRTVTRFKNSGDAFKFVEKAPTKGWEIYHNGRILWSDTSHFAKKAHPLLREG